MDPTVKLGEHAVTLQRPRVSTALALLQRQTRGKDRPMLGNALACVALRECWPDDAAWPVRPPPRRWTLADDIAEFGRDIFDALLAGGVSPGRLLPAAEVAWALAMDVIPTQQAVDRAVGFSEAPEPGA
jgi:hypothetical protein